MKTLLIGIVSVLAAHLLSGCSKDNAGVGGKAQINVKVIYDNTNVPESEIKVMYNARTFPGSEATYNNSVVSDYKANAEFKNLRRGDYYFYSSAIINDSLMEGGAYVRIKSKKGETHVVIDFGADDPFDNIVVLENP